MEGEVSVDDVMSEEMLQQLRHWQQEQKSRLMEQQQQQRQLLLEKQKKLLSMINTCEVPSNISDNNIQHEESFKSTATGGNVDNQKERTSPKLCANSPTCVDDVPLKKPRAVRSFQQLLENSISTKDHALSSQNVTQAKKFPFLKRGQGISRFGSISKPKADKTTHSKKRSGKENKIPPAPSATSQHDFQTNEKFPSSVTQNQMISKPTYFEPSKKEIVQETKTTNMQIVPFQEPKFDESSREPNSSRNEEDLAVFELLERFANINASFSSSSSLIGQLIDKGVTHLPSPSKVISFLSRKRTNLLANSGEEVTVEGERKPSKPSRHVRFAECVDEEESCKPDEDYSRPWLADISEEDISESHPSPFISNTIRPSQQSNVPTSFAQDRDDLDETPTSPIGFPDYQKLFGNSARSLWANEESLSPTQDEYFPKKSKGSDPIVDQFKGTVACHNLVSF